MVPKCVRRGLPCLTHQDNKYLKWPCGLKYSSKDRHKRFIKTKIPCRHCGQKSVKGLCKKCYYITHSSPLLGKKLPLWWCKRISDGQGKQDKSPFWKGQNVSYSTKHKWIVKVYGHPTKCEECELKGSVGKRCWNIDWANISKEYKRERKDFKGLCRKCHISFDRKNRLGVGNQKC